MTDCAKIISIVNQKGGVGKTTTAINLAVALSIFDKKILLIDLDPQGNLTTGIGVDINTKNKEKNIYNVLTTDKDAKDILSKTFIPNIDIITANQDLAAFDIEIKNISDKEFLLDQKLQKIKQHYNYILIDCAPSLSQLTVNALTTSNSVLIPLQCEFFALKGLSNILQIINSVKINLNTKLIIEGILLTMYNRKDRLCKEIVADVRENFGNLVYNQMIPRNMKLSEANSYAKPVILYDNKCSGSISYILLAQEILNKKYNTL